MCKRKPGPTLTDKEKMFCEKYILDLDATKAAIRAGYSEASAKTTAYHIRQRPDVAAYITQLLTTGPCACALRPMKCCSK